MVHLLMQKVLAKLKMIGASLKGIVLSFRCPMNCDSRRIRQ